MPKITSEKNIIYKGDSFFISIVSFIMALVLQSGLLCLIWYFCLNSDIKKKAKLITISLVDFTQNKELLPETRKEPLIEPLKHTMEEKTEPEKKSEPVIDKLDPMIEELNPIDELEPVLEKIEPVFDDLKPIIEEQEQIKEIMPVLEEIKPKKIVNKPKSKPVIKKPEPKLQKQEVKPVEKVIEKNTEEIPTQTISEKKQSEVVDTPVSVTETPAEIIKPKQPLAKLGKEADRYMARLAKLFEKNKKYPENARRKHISGIVTLKFYIDLEGKVSNCKVINDSHELLSASAIELVTKLKLPKPPSDWEADRPIIFNINYNLR